MSPVKQERRSFRGYVLGLVGALDVQKYEYEQDLKWINRLPWRLRQKFWFVKLRGVNGPTKDDILADYHAAKGGP